ncbi:uncharacterized protein DSM5745_09002 [Aspergillus mulundensis]|uniref:Uncharacterized protein n=1 Tax=Aspergillus mulundensis TaxID=1810919 RepID=A0A3D8QZA5_9EURO|nr:hypothetical protein DSM5745_09002 [Aspergillus mulundensis]RDW67136.1 hypothetical protein DSM5745_09002 [Aspergillus mulundensis]
MVLSNMDYFNSKAHRDIATARATDIDVRIKRHTSFFLRWQNGRNFGDAAMAAFVICVLDPERQAELENKFHDETLEYFWDRMTFHEVNKSAPQFNLEYDGWFDALPEKGVTQKEATPAPRTALGQKKVK